MGSLSSKWSARATCSTGWLSSGSVWSSRLIYRENCFSWGRKPDKRLGVFERTFARCMGLFAAGDGRTLWMNSRYQLWRFDNVIVTNNTGSAGTLYGWIDYNNNGVFENATERAQVAVANGSNNVIRTLTFPAVPFGFTGKTYARFRLSTAAAAANPTGAASNGEVEDYVARITLPSDSTVQSNVKISDGLAGFAPSGLDAEDRFGSALASLTSAPLRPVVDSAIARLIAQGLTATQVNQLSSVTVDIADLPGAGGTEIHVGLNGNDELSGRPGNDFLVVGRGQGVLNGKGNQNRLPPGVTHFAAVEDNTAFLQSMNAAQSGAGPFAARRAVLTPDLVPRSTVLNTGNAAPLTSHADLCLDRLFAALADGVIKDAGDLLTLF